MPAEVVVAADRISQALRHGRDALHDQVFLDNHGQPLEVGLRVLRLLRGRLRVLALTSSPARVPALRAAVPEVSQYPSAQGTPALRRAAAQRSSEARRNQPFFSKASTRGAASVGASEV